METMVYTGHHQAKLPSLELVWTHGSQRGKRFPVYPGQQTYGREATNNIVLDCPTISKNHGILLYQEKGKVVVYDTLSRNGISKKGKKEVLVTLKVGQEIQIGSESFKLVPEGEEAYSNQKHSALLLTSAAFLLLTSVTLGATLGWNLWKQHTPIPKALPALSNPTPQIPQTPPPPEVIPQLMTTHITRKHKTLQPLESKPSTREREWEQQAHTAFSNGQFEKASNLWKKILNHDPSNHNAQEGLKSLEQIASLSSPSLGGF